MVKIDTPDAETPLPSTETDIPPTTDEPSLVTDAEWQAMLAVMTTVYSHRTPDGQDPSKPFHKNVNRRQLPDYYELIKEPMAMSTVKVKVQNRQYKSFSEFVRDFALIVHNAQVYNKSTAGVYQCAIEIKALLERELGKLVERKVVSAEVAKLPYLGEIPDQEATEEAEEEEEEEEEEDSDEDEGAVESDDSGGKIKRRRGRKKASEKRSDKEDREFDSMKKRGRPPKVDTPMESRIKNILKGIRRLRNDEDQSMIEHFLRLPDRAAMPEYFAEIKDPIAIDLIKKKLKRKKFASVDQFMRDVELMFENAKLYNEDGSEIFKDAVELQKQARMLAEAEQSRPDADFVTEDGRLPLPDGILHNGELYKVGDWVHIQNVNDLTKPVVSQIYRTWQDASGQKFVNVCWYYRPEQTVHRFDKHFYENEVVKTGRYVDHPVEDIVDRCFVMFITKYTKGRPANWPADKEVYICESRYNEEKHTLNKVKTWASCLPDEVRDKNYEMEMFGEPRRLKKKPSPIAYLLKDSQKETDDLPSPQWGAENAPPKIGAVHRRPRDPRDSLPPEPTPSPPPQPPPQPASITRPMPSAPLGQRNMSNSTPINRNQMPGSTPISNSIAPQQQAQRPLSAATTSQSFSNQPPLRPAHAPQVNYNANNYAANRYPVANNAYPPPSNYKAPLPIEVWSLTPAANAGIPADIREQFQCDENGNVLFFTAPPVDSALTLKRNETLGHSAKFIAMREKQEALKAEKRKLDEEATAKERDERLKRARQEMDEYEDTIRLVGSKALNAWEKGLLAATIVDYQRAYGNS